MTEANPRQNVTFASNGGEAHGYLAKPGSGSGPGAGGSGSGSRAVGPGAAGLGYDVDGCFASCKAEIDALLEREAYLIVISNEIGMGLHAETETGRKFTDLQGWVNQYLAARADEVIFMISGIPLTVK